MMSKACQWQHLQPFPHPLNGSPCHRRRPSWSSRTTFHKPVLVVPDPLIVLRMPCDDTQDNLLHDLPQHKAWQACSCPDPPSYTWSLDLLVSGWLRPLCLVRTAGKGWKVARAGHRRFFFQIRAEIWLFYCIHSNWVIITKTVKQ